MLLSFLLRAGLKNPAVLIIDKIKNMTADYLFLRPTQDPAQGGVDEHGDGVVVDHPDPLDGGLQNPACSAFTRSERRLSSATVGDVSKSDHRPDNTAVLVDRVAGIGYGKTRAIFSPQDFIIDMARDSE